MKSLDINTASANYSAYDSRRILIEFTGGNFTQRLQGTTTHTVIVPYSSLSRKLQTIQRLGGKIINVSIHPQLEVLKVNPENANPEQINEPILEVHHQISPKETPKQSVEQPIAETLENGVVEVDEITSGAFPELTLQTISEIAHQEVSDANSENVSAAPQVITPKKKKAVSESTTSSKKTKASTKASQEVSKQDSNPQVQEPIAIAETITIFEQVLEPEPEIVVETISAIIPETNLKLISEETLPTTPQTESQEPIAPLPKSKTTKDSSKSGHGFNKPKSGTKSPRSLK
ncbi:phycobilisome core linker-like [Pseudanabaena sp. lw0831]|uniref:phycobilisome linker polypeptide n=1 Tax=Pseudanabaena sp. lw0831 TaxID=1357935 RepID=UPI001914D9F2|nr:phycobilisome linker polypeptide [Pseudanabaena sp. lw0831]GBO52391.1 phycobilisome core linker-like [Pseudanabaena sp. lw0831]